MLKEVLQEISIAKVFSIALISKNLNIAEALIEDAVEQLSRMGYILEDMGSPTCETKCSGCTMSSMCNVIPLKTISITEKGHKLLKNI